jgi:hypothetical protein
MHRLAVTLAASVLLGVLAPTSQAGQAPSGPASDGHVRRAPVSPVVARALGPTGEMRGMALNDANAGRPFAATVVDFPRMAAEGITSVTAYIYLYVSDPTGTEVTAGTQTATDAELDAVAAAARANHLDLHLMPVLLDTATNGFRGRYRPRDPDAFFRSYTAQLVHYADLAQRNGATLFYVGSENEMIAPQTARWRKLIATVRTHYSGALSYMATPLTATQAKFWGDLDVASISPYFALAEDDNPTYERFMAAWNETHTRFVRKLAATLRKPLVFGEIGYNSQQHAFANPSMKPPYTKLAAPAAQADAYRALLDAVKGNPSVYGVTWWRWAPATTAVDTTFSPNGKPAECVIAAYWSQNPKIRSVASAPVCDLHAFDQAMAAVGGVLQQ